MSQPTNADLISEIRALRLRVDLLMPESIDILVAKRHDREVKRMLEKRNAEVTEEAFSNIMANREEGDAHEFTVHELNVERIKIMAKGWTEGRPRLAGR